MSRDSLFIFATATTTLVLGGLLTTTWTPTVSTEVLADAGIQPNFVATCNVRFAPDCLEDVQDAGIPAHRYERISFPVYVQVDVDAGTRDVVAPPNIPQSTWADQRCVQVMDWSTCSMVPCASNPAVCALWGSSMPLTLVPRECVRQVADAGLPCPRWGGDGGSMDYGDLNVFPRALAVDPAQCESVNCTVYAGDNPATEL